MNNCREVPIVERQTYYTANNELYLVSTKNGSKLNSTKFIFLVLVCLWPRTWRELYLVFRMSRSGTPRRITVGFNSCNKKSSLFFNILLYLQILLVEIKVKMYNEYDVYVQFTSKRSKAGWWIYTFYKRITRNSVGVTFYLVFGINKMRRAWQNTTDVIFTYFYLH